MSTIFDKNLLPEFDSIKDNDEQIIWICKPKFIPYVFNSLIGSVIAIISTIAMFLFFTHVKNEDGSIGFGFFSYFIFLIPMIQILYSIGLKLLSFPNTAYGYSNKRIMMRTGFIGTDFKTIDYDKISDIEVTVNFIERAFNVGTIRFFSGRTKVTDDSTENLYDNWYAIPNPYELFKQVKKVAVDVKTDYNYPNALRPETNPGYKTTYNPK
jgi:membrane protein YdbS with pleckstrin-like domain